MGTGAKNKRKETPNTIHNTNGLLAAAAPKKVTITAITPIQVGTGVNNKRQETPNAIHHISGLIAPFELFCEDISIVSFGLLKIRVWAQAFFHFFGVASLFVVGAPLPVVAGEAIVFFVIPFLGRREEVAGFVVRVVVGANHCFDWLVVFSGWVVQTERWRVGGGHEKAQALEACFCVKTMDCASRMNVGAGDVFAGR